MTLIDRLNAVGFERVVVLDGAECGYPECGRILLALMAYQPEGESTTDDVQIHPYYYTSQRAYEAARKIAAEEAALTLRDDIRVKPIFARLSCFSQGRNTLSYIDSWGSRFHVQIFSCASDLPVTHHLDDQFNRLHCGDCHRCEQACPTNALEGSEFHRERCIRNWQLSGQPVPLAVREKMGGRLIGCDVCQHVCPHNGPVQAPAPSPVSLQSMLESPKEAAQMLKPLIGSNLAIPNRVLSQACIMAGCKGGDEYITALERHLTHPSPIVRDHAAWALERIKELNT